MDDVMLGRLAQLAEDNAAEITALAVEVRRVTDGCVQQQVCTVRHGALDRRVTRLEEARVRGWQVLLAVALALVSVGVEVAKAVIK